MPCREPARTLLLRYLLAQRPWRLLDPAGQGRPSLQHPWLESRLAAAGGLRRCQEVAAALPASILPGQEAFR